MPNVNPVRNQKVANQFIYAQYFSGNSLYGLIGDSHMMKNSEWGAVAYLSHSIYGKYGNDIYSGANKEIYINNFYGDDKYNSGKGRAITGMSAGAVGVSVSQNVTCRYDAIQNRGSGTGACGAGASTTGNIYGIYDMSGGNWDFVMGYYEGASTIWGATTNDDYAEFTAVPELQYFNGYNSNRIFNKSKEVVGHSTYETKKWYADYSYIISGSNPWIIRGGLYSNYQSSGVFSSHNSNGSSNGNYTFRSVLSTIKS